MKKSERTRQAILESARQLFLKRSYDQVGLREIAAQAKVTAALVNRYFGSKQNLFREVLQDDTDYSELYHGPKEELGKRLAHFLIEGKLTKKDGELLAVNHEKLLLYVRSVGCPEAVPLLRDALAQKITGPLMKELPPGDDVNEKAAVLLSHFFGFLLVHSMIGAACAVKARREVVEAQLAASLQAIIDA